MQLDYTIDSIEERKKLVEKILQEETNPNLEYLANYLIMCMEKQERKEKKIITDNRQVTITKRETSYEGLVDKMESGESALYHMARSDKNILFQPKKLITKEDYAAHPELRQIKEAIDTLKKQQTTGRVGYFRKKALIELYKDLYLAKKELDPPVMPSARIMPKYYRKLEGISLSDPEVVSNILCLYSKLKQEAWGNFEGDLWYLLETLDKVMEDCLSDNPYYKTIVRMKIDGCTNLQIQEELQKTLGLKPTQEYISTLWRNRIPKYIADHHAKLHVIWLYKYTGQTAWKRCSRCHQYKPALPYFFSKNKTSKDGYYSLCKDCRNKKKG